MSLEQFWEAVQEEETKIKHLLEDHHKRHKFHGRFMAFSFFISLLFLIALSAIYLRTSVASRQVMFRMLITDSLAVPLSSTNTSTPLAYTSGPSSGSSYYYFPLPNQPEYFLRYPYGEFFFKSPILRRPVRRTTFAAVPFQFSLFPKKEQSLPAGSVTQSEAPPAPPKIKTKKPTFRGRVKLPRAVILLEIHSEPPEAMTTVIQADGEGNWEFSAPNELSDGEHTVYMVVFDPETEAELISTAMDFVVETTTEQKSKEPGQAESPEQTSQPSPTPISAALPPPPEASDYAKGQLLFDIRATILPSYEVINPGQNLLVELYLVNLSTGGRVTDVTVSYRIKNSQDQIVLEQSETLAVPYEQLFVRIFNTAYRLPSGRYTFETSLPYPDGRVEAVSATSFEVKGDPVLELKTGVKLNLNLILQALGLLLTVFSLITYYEFKQVRALAKIIHQVTEKDLAAKGFIHH